MTRMAGKNALIELLRHEGVKYVFGIPCAAEIQFMDDLEESPDIRYILGLHEVVCVGMAEGYARASGKIGFLTAKMDLVKVYTGTSVLMIAIVITTILMMFFPQIATWLLSRMR